VNHISKTGAGFLFSNARIIDSNDQDVGRFLVDIKDPNLLKLIRGKKKKKKKKKKNSLMQIQL